MHVFHARLLLTQILDGRRYWIELETVVLLLPKLTQCRRRQPTGWAINSLRLPKPCNFDSLIASVSIEFAWQEPFRQPSCCENRKTFTMSSEQYSDRADSARRASSFGAFIKRSKSNDLLSERKTSASPGLGPGLRKKSSEGEKRSLVDNSPPALPVVPSQPVIDSFGGEDYVPSAQTMSTRVTNGQWNAPPVPSVPAGLQDRAADPYARTESMTNRSRYSYANSTSSSLTSPRRVRRRRDPTPYK